MLSSFLEGVMGKVPFSCRSNGVIVVREHDESRDDMMIDRSTWDGNRVDRYVLWKVGKKMMSEDFQGRARMEQDSFH